ncbi:sulfatase-like hydrolase/transferase [Aeoliella mucimassa]|uniref:Arylsulfatase n=1 Tax=Aeoliella mucimassa TaxID=2527972 RepID=A0A518APC7_9BACT|nr:sulfatase-like hydrolase/transferase [Aeoliella mucimassa]QDU56583.1 Arylsulfatase precursor [Aeoliella mucimassa]
MHKRILRKHFVFSSLLLTLVVAASAAQADPPPNIVVFLSDDHTRADSSLYGSPDMSTPNMERIAQQGMMFEHAFVASPSCAPSRAALLTGLMPARNGAERNHARPRADIKKLPAYLHDLGYQVVSFGKVGHYNQTPEYGFDIARHFNYHDDVAVSEAMKWLENRKDERPLCLFVGTNWPHVPWPKPSTIDLDKVQIPAKHVETPETTRARGMYYQAIRTMDDELGFVFDTAYRKLGDNTLFLHTSDHGAQWPFSKWNLYDDGIRTPMVAVWPEHIKQGEQTAAMVSWVDILPTIVEAAGGTPPESIDGKSMVPVLEGKSDSHRDYIYTAHSGDGNFNVYPSRSIRDARYKYIRNLHPEFEFRSHVTDVVNDSPYWPSWEKKAKYDQHAADVVHRYLQRPREELYDLQNDPDETHNLIAESDQADRVTKMSQLLDTWMEEQGDQQRVYGLPRLHREGKPSPNVVMVFIDDMGWTDLSCFGGEAVETQNIDQLAREGLRFTNFYVNAPICSPSRTSLTTGNYPARHRITSYLARRELNHQRGIVNWLDPEAVTLPRLFSEAGYRVGHFGKWHMGGQRDVAEAPLVTEYGFDASLTNFEGLGPRVLPLCYDGKSTEPHRHDLGSATLGHGPIEWEDRSIITQRFTQRALQFIDESVAADKPFYINVWPDDVHSPFFPPLEQRGEGGKRKLYQAVLKSMDEQLAPLFDRVRNDPKLRDNTIIVLASDNGPEPGAGTSEPLRGAKGSLYEGGIRSPLIVWGPGLVQPEAAGTTNETTIVSSVDLVASLTTLGHLNPPESYQCDGEDLLAVLLGMSDAQRSGPLFWRRPPDRPGPKNDPNPDLAVRENQWKLVTNIDGSNTQLFNLKRDPSETKDVSSRNPRVTERLKRNVLNWNRGLPEDAIGVPPASNAKSNAKQAETTESS